MPAGSQLDYRKALEDFYSARAKGALDETVARLAGSPFGLLQYDEVRRHFNVIESSRQKRMEIPLDSIVGTVSRVNDFSRKLLPLRAQDRDRWAKVKLLVEDPAGLPPIEVYQVGEAYFIIDGHHRASVARQMGATHIEALVRQVYTKVPLTPGDDLAHLILKSEYADFLTRTRLDELRPDSNLSVTQPGEYQTLLGHISAHQHIQGLQEKGELSFEEAALDWHDRIYLPVIKLIRSRNLLRYFPGQTETDLYLGIMEYRTRSEEQLGWKITPRDAAQNLTENFAKDARHRLERLLKKTFDRLTPDPLEPATPPGFWRQGRKTGAEDSAGLFDTILVALPGTERGWNALDAALFIGKNEQASVSGLTVVRSEADKASPFIAGIENRFSLTCQQTGSEGRMAVEVGHVQRVIYERSFWVDLVVLPFAYPPPYQTFQRLNYGLRSLIRRSATPLLLVPALAPTQIRCALLAYGGGRLADEALYMAAYLSSRFKIDLAVITIGGKGKNAAELHQRARAYLDGMGISQVTYIEEAGDAAQAILNSCHSHDCDVILMGGYEGGLIKEIFSGSTVDRVLRSTDRMVMICR